MQLKVEILDIYDGSIVHRRGCYPQCSNYCDRDSFRHFWFDRNCGVLRGNPTFDPGLSTTQTSFAK